MHVEDGQEDQHLRSARRTVTRPPHGATSATDRLGSISSLLLVVRSPYALPSRQTRRWHDLLAYTRLVVAPDLKATHPARPYSTAQGRAFRAHNVRQ